MTTDKNHGNTVSNKKVAHKDAVGLGVASLIVGIVAFFCGIIPFAGFVFGIVAIILAAVAFGRPHGKEFAIVGLITGILGAIASLVMTVIFFMVLVLGGAVIGTIQESAYEYNAANQAKLEARKDFAKGETAVFDSYEIKVDSLKVYTPTDDYSVAGDGKEFVSVAVSIKNISDTPQQVSPYDFRIIEKDATRVTSYLSDKKFEQVTINPDETIQRSIVYEVTKDAPHLKFSYATQAYDPTTFQATSLVYTLVLR